MSEIIEADLHFHSMHSDGFVSIEVLAEKIRARSLKMVSLTDHDTVAGTSEISRLLANRVEIISGTELSCEFQNRELHLLGYRIDPNSPRLLERLAFFADQRTERFKRMLVKLAGLGVRLDFDEVRARCKRSVLGRPHLARALVDQRHCSTQEEAYIRYIGDRGPAYERKFRFSLKEAVDLIREVGGISIVAHPGLYHFKEDFILAARDVGVNGIEIAHPKHNSAQRKFYEKLGKAHKLIMTGGSDYHGSGRSDDCELGMCGLNVKTLKASGF